MHRVAFYTRISTDEDHQKYSLDAQKDRLEAFCKSQYGDEWEMFKLYRDTESGTHMNRPGLEEMLYDASLKAFNVLLVFRVDRLSRKVRELAQMVDELTKQGIILKSITEPFDTANAAGKMMLQMLGVFAEFEHATIVERTKVGMEKKAKGGDFVGGYVPFGYRLEPDKGLVLREEESLLVKKMFSMYALGKEGSHTICLKLNEAGNRRRSGKKWDKRVIINILRNPLYIGKLRWREVVYEGNHEAIVSETLFNQTQELLDQRRDDLSGRRWNNGSRLLSGLMQCVRCRRAMVGISCHKKNAGSIPYYACTARLSTHDCEQDYVRADLLEAAVIQDIKAMFRDEGFMARVWAEANRRLDQEKPDMDKDIRRVESQMADVRARTERYLEAFETGKLDADTCNQKVRDLKARLAELEGERTELESRRERLSLPAMDREFLRRTLDDFEVVMASEENARKKHLLRRLVKKVLVHNRNTVEIWYGLPAPDPARIEGSMAPEPEHIRSVSDPIFSVSEQRKPRGRREPQNPLESGQNANARPAGWSGGSVNRMVRKYSANQLGSPGTTPLEPLSVIAPAYARWGGLRRGTPACRCAPERQSEPARESPGGRPGPRFDHAAGVIIVRKTCRVPTTNRP